MVEIYSNLRKNTKLGGAQTIMFTHSSNDVWLQLSEIIWKSGLYASSLWAIRTETENASKGKGNFVQATYLITLRERSNNKTGTKTKVRQEVINEVERLYASMTRFSKGENAEFSELDFQLIPATAVLKVTTGYAEDSIIGLPEQEREKFQRSLLDEASKIISEKRCPETINKEIWNKLGNGEKFYLMGLDQEQLGENSIQYYMNSSKGFGIKDFKDILGENTANKARLQHPGEIRERDSISKIIGTGPVFAMVCAVHTAVKESSEIQGHQRIKEVMGNRMSNPEQISTLKEIAQFFARLKNLEHWAPYSKAAEEMCAGIGRV